MPEKLPPSLRLDKTSGIKYQLIATLKVRLKKGLLRKKKYETTVQDIQDLVLEKHELHSTWPIYNQPEEFETKEGPFSAKLFRNKCAYGVTDQMDVRLVVSSQAAKTVKLKSITIGVRQTVTFFPEKGASSQPIHQKSEMLATKTKRLGKKIMQGEFFLQDLSLVIPKNHAIMSIHTAKHIEISHCLRVDINLEKSTLTFDRIDVLISGFLPSASSSLITRIGDVPSLDATQESNPHSAREHTSVFVPEGESILPSHVPLEDPDPAIYTDDAVPMPDIESSDFAALGTATPHRPVSFTSSPVSPTSAWRASTTIDPSISMRPGDILPMVSAGPTDPSLLRNSARMSQMNSLPTPNPAATSTPSPITRVKPPQAAVSSGSFRTAEQEKVQLFERARAEAEQYQSEMGEDVTFPRENRPMGDYSMHNVNSSNPNNIFAAHASVPSHAEEGRRLRINPEAPSHPDEDKVSSPYITKSEAQAMEEKSKLQSHYAQLDARQVEPVSSYEPTPAPSYMAPPGVPRSQPSEPGSSGYPPRPPKVPLS